VELSARNQLAGKVKKITLGGVMAEVTIDIGNGKEIVAAVTRVSVENMNLAEGSDVVAVIKATEVLIGKK
jgi:molybdopterin-binding protein